MSTDRIAETDRELWQSLTTGPEVASTSVSDDNEFAAWLEGRLSETEAARIEAAVAASPELRRAAMELSDILGKPLPEAPTRMVVRGQALVGFEAERQVAAGGGWLAGLWSRAGAFAMPRAVMASMAMVVAAAGFMMGGGLGESIVQDKHVTVASIAFPGENPNDMTAFFSTDGL